MSSENPHGNWKIKNVNRSDYLGRIESSLTCTKRRKLYNALYLAPRPCSQLDIEESIEAKRLNQTEAIRESAKNI